MVGRLETSDAEKRRTVGNRCKSAVEENSTCVFHISILRSSAYDIHVITARFLAATPVLRRRVTYRGNLRIDFVNCFPLGSFSEPITPVVALCFSSRRPFDIPRYSLSLSLWRIFRDEYSSSFVVDRLKIIKKNKGVRIKLDNRWTLNASLSRVLSAR